MALPGPKGNEELAKIKEEKKKKWAEDPSTKAEIANTPGASIEIVMKCKVTMISDDETEVKQIECGFPVPEECSCSEHTFKMTYKVDWEAQCFVVSPNIVGSGPPPDAKPIAGRDYTGSSYGSFTVKDEVVKEVTVDCPPGFYDLPKLPGNLASLTPGTVIAGLIGKCMTARFAYLGTIISNEGATIFRRLQSGSAKTGEDIARTPADWIVTMEKTQPSPGLTAAELATWNLIEDQIGPYMTRMLATYSHSAGS
jgi:hypothetical protein